MIRTLVACLLTVTVAACAEILPVGPMPAVGEASDDLFLLVVRSPSARYAVGQPIDVTAELVYQGPKGREKVFHAVWPVGWQIVQQDGPAVMGGGMGQPCRSTELDAGRVVRYPFVKAGIHEDRPPFDRAWFEDPVVRLPAGRWRFQAMMSVSLGDCGGESRSLGASVDVVVGP